jgi:hypothetical protein
VDDAPTCSRLGCDAPAVAVFAFDARECLVWLDPFDPGDPGARGAGLLCGPHADRMSPPRGWNLLDRRETESRLWIGRTTVVAALPPRRRERAPRTRACTSIGPHLPFDTVASEHEVQVAREPEPARPPWSPHDRPGPELEHVLDARTPLLARAFEAARPGDDPQ